MSDLSTKKMLTAYVEGKDAHKPGFFTSFFNDVEFHNSSKVELDVRRKGARIAPVLQALGAGNVRIEMPKITNNEWTPPVYGLEFALNATDAMHRSIGEDPYNDVDFMANIQKRFLLEMPVCHEMIMRGIELQCAQVLKTGVLTLPGTTGATAFTLDYGAETDHKLAGVSNDWDLTSGTDRLGDVRAAANLVFNDSGFIPKYAIMGELAREAFLADDVVQTQTRKDGTGVGEQVPPQMRNGGAYFGRVAVGQFNLEIWSTNSFYESFEAGTPTKYLGDWEVIIVGENVPLTLTYGGIPRMKPIDPALQSLAIGRVSDAGRKTDLITNAWFSPDGNQLFGSVGARPLAVPRAIDGFASINTKVS